MQYKDVSRMNEWSCVVAIGQLVPAYRDDELQPVYNTLHVHASQQQQRVGKVEYGS